MTVVATKSKYHVALDGLGLILQGAPGRLAYKMSNAPVYGTRFASGDRDYNDLSQWWYLTQTDWSGGIKDFQSFVDDAKYYYSTNIDAWSELGKIKLARKNVAYNTFAENLTCGASALNGTSPNKYYGTDQNGTGEPKVYEETAALPGTFTSVFNSLTDSNDTAVSHIFSNQGTIIALLVGTDQTGTILVWEGGSADVTANADSVMFINSNSARCGVSINGTAYIFIDNNASSYGIVKTSNGFPNADADWTLVADIRSQNRIPIACVEYLGNILYLAVSNGGTILELRQINLTGTTDILIREFKNITIPVLYGLNNLLKVFGSKLVITVPSEEIWTYDGSSLERIYRKDVTKKGLSNALATGNLAKGCIESEQMLWWGNLSWNGSAFHNTIKSSDDSASGTTYPLFAHVDDTRYYGESTETKRVTKVTPTGTDYKNGASNSAFLIMSQHDKIKSIDKLLNKITLGFENFATGQEINVYYTTNPIPSVTSADWTLLGSASYALDGASLVSKDLQFPVGVVTKTLWIRLELVSSTAGTPVVTDATLEYLPIPDYKKQWSLNVNAGDETLLLDGQAPTLRAREVKSKLERLWWTKSGLDFQDVDYATTTLNGALNNSATTITVVNTDDFPEQGRLKVDLEEILYTGKTRNSFTGCVRGSRGTRAASHSSAAVINNAYKVLVMGIEEDVPIMQEDKELEYVVGLSLREV